MVRSDLLRIATAALALTALSFAVGVAGDLAASPPGQSGVRVVLRIPPELPPPASAVEDAARQG